MYAEFDYEVWFLIMLTTAIFIVIEQLNSSDVMTNRLPER